jgi:signal transduction histidine kinase
LQQILRETSTRLGFTEDENRLLQTLGGRMEKHLPALVRRLLDQIPEILGAGRLSPKAPFQMDRLRADLDEWARGLFCGRYDDAYGEYRLRVGLELFRTGIEQKQIIAIVGLARSLSFEYLLQEFPAGDERLLCARALGKIFDMDMILLCECHTRASLENLHQANRQLEDASIEVTRASRIKDEFLAQVSHELRTPLNSILGFTRLILDGWCRDREEERELLRDVFSSSKHLLSLVNDLLDVTRLEAGRSGLQLTRIDPRSILESTLALAAVQAATKKLTLRDETLGMALPPVRADEMRFRQVLLNLLSNAVKFTPSGAVTLRAAVRRNESSLQFDVEDTGLGVRLEERELVFEDFFQSDSGSTRRHDGTGLGLAISRRLVEQMGGQIGLRRGDGGQGTVVWFTLPLASSTPSPSPSPTSTPEAT